MEEHERIAKRLNKRLVLEEFGISRDQNRYEEGTPVTVRDKYYRDIFDEAFRQSSQPHSVLSGVNFWAWAGEGRPRQAGGYWKPGDAFIGDPPHESQGWYSVYDTDSSTLQLIREEAERFNQIGK